jgi:hypothetical protein
MKLMLGLICCYLSLPVAALLSAPQLLSSPQNKMEANSTRAVIQLLENRWERGETNDAESSSQFVKSPHDNPHVLVAYILNRMQHGKFDDALQFATEVRQRFKSNLDGPMLEIWLLALTNEYESAIVRMSAFKKALVRAKADGKLSADIEQKIFGRLGRLLGYLEGPVANKVNPQLIAQIGEQLQSDLAPESNNAFSLNRTAVKVKFEELLNDQTEFENVELTRVAASNEVEKQRLEQDNQIVQQTRERLQPRLDQLTADASSQSSVLEQQIRSSASELDLLNRSAFRTEQDLAFMYADLLSINRRYRRGGYTFGVYGLEDQIYRTENQLAQLRYSAINQANNLAALQNQLNGTRIRYSRQIDDVQRQLRRTDVVQKRNGRQLQKIAEGPKIAGGKKTARKQRRTALRTYDDLSLELYRQEMLEAVN